MRAAIDEREIGDSTVMILSAKHGQSPQTPSAMTRIPDGPIIDALNAAWKAAHPTAVQPLAAFSINDDGMLLWLNEHTQAAADFAKDFLLHHSGTGNDINGNPKPYTSSGLTTIYAGTAAAAYFHVPYSDSRVPDIFGVSQYGTVFTGGKKKIAEHGGANIQDRHVPLVVSGGPIEDHAVRSGQVETTQIAPTILKILGLDPSALKAARIEHTAALPLSEADAAPSDQTTRP